MRWLKLARRIVAGILIVTGVIGLAGTPDDLVTWGGLVEPVGGRVGWAVLVGLGLLLVVPWERLQARDGNANGTTRADTRSRQGVDAAPLLGGVTATQGPQIAAEGENTEFVFDEAPPELADMSPTSIKEVFAGRTDAQAAKLMEQHVGKPVRVSGAVEGVELERIPNATLKSVVSVLLFFDADDYDAEPLLLALNKGDKIVASGQVYKIKDGVVTLDRCKLLEARGRAL